MSSKTAETCSADCQSKRQTFCPVSAMIKMLELKPDYFCWPLWDINPGGCYDLDRGMLPLTAELEERIERWALVYDAQLNMTDPQSSWWFREDQKAAFQQEGDELIKLIQEELGQNYKVIRRF